MSTDKLSIANAAISATGAAFLRNGVKFDRTLSLDQLSALAAAVTEMHGGTAWWYGDIGLEIQARNREANELKAQAEDARVKTLERELEHVEGKERDDVRIALHDAEARAAELRGDQCYHYLGNLSEALGIDSGYWRNCIMVARFFQSSCRHDDLSINHHYEAIRGAGGVEGKMIDAKAWLTRAAESEWSVAELRKEINLSKMTAPLTPHPPFENEFEPLDAADKWAMRFKSDTRITSDSAKKLLTRFQAIRDFLRRLEEIAAKS